MEREKVADPGGKPLCQMDTGNRGGAHAAGEAQPTHDFVARDRFLRNLPGRTPPDSGSLQVGF